VTQLSMPAPARPVAPRHAATTLTVGLDVGDRYSAFHVIDTAGDVVEKGRLATDPTSVAKWFGPLPPARVVLESSTHSPWLSRLLAQLGHEVIVGNTRRLELISRSDDKCDGIDAELLARLGRVDPTLLKPVAHRGEQAQVDLAHIRTRDAVVRARTLLVNHTRSVTKSVGGRLPRCSTASFSRQVMPELPEALRPQLTPVLEQITSLTQAIRRADREIERLVAERYPEAQALTQVAGVGALTALCYILVLEQHERFSTSRAVGSYLGLRPRRRQSSDVDPECHITKTGDVLLRRLLVGSAQYILGPFGPDCDLRRWGLRLAGRGKKAAKKRAVVAVARKLAVLLHHLWRTQEPYVSLRTRPARSQTA
jgi:transposase